MKTIKIALTIVLMLSVLMFSGCGHSSTQALYQEAQRVLGLYQEDFEDLFNRNLEHFEVILASSFMERTVSAGKSVMTYWSCPYGNDMSFAWGEEQRNVDWMTDELYYALTAIFVEMPYAHINTWWVLDDDTDEIGLSIRFFNSEHIESTFRGRSSATFSFDYGRTWDERSQIMPPLYLRNGWQIYVTSFWSS